LTDSNKDKDVSLLLKPTINMVINIEMVC